MRSKILWIQEEYLQQILDGRKTIEVRVAYSNITRLQPGDMLLLNEYHRYTITRIGHYPNFEDLLQHESAATIAPHIDPENLLSKIREIYPKEKEALGVVALEIKPAIDTNETRQSS